jgi:cobalt-zinc-cadmium efflux system outer membrane protein
MPVNGRRSLLRESGEAQSRAAESEAAYELLLLRSDLRAAFYGLLLAQERAALLDAWVRRLTTIAGVLQERERQGEGSAFDRLRGQRELADAQAALASQQAQLARARSQLASFFAPGTDSSALVARGTLVETDLAPLPPLAELLTRALQARGDYAAVQRQIESAGFERRAASRLAIPDPLLTAGLKSSTAPGRSGNGYVVSVTVPVPLFNRGQADATRFRATEERSRAELAARRQQIESDVRAAHEAVALRRRAAGEYASRLGESAGDLARIAEVAYQEGDTGILELLDAQRVAAFSGLQSLDLAWSSKQAEIDLNRSVGEEVLP